MITTDNNAFYIENKMSQTPASNAGGYISFKQLPISGEKISLNGVDVIFGTTVSIGATIDATLDNILAYAGLPTSATYIKSGNTLSIRYTLKGSIGNAYTLYSDATGSIISGETLTGGIDSEDGLWSEETGSTVTYKTEEQNIIEKLTDDGFGGYLTDSECSVNDSVLVVNNNGVVNDTVANIDVVKRSKYANDVAEHIHDLRQESVNFEYNMSESDFANWAISGITFPVDMFFNTIESVNGYVYSIGGEANNTVDYYDTIYSYTKSNNLFGLPSTSAFTLPSETSRHCSYTANDKIYVLGGINSTDGIKDSIYVIYLNADGTIKSVETSITKLPVPLYSFYIVIIKDIIYVMGGKTYDTDGVSEIYNNNIYTTNIYSDGTISGNWALYRPNTPNMYWGSVFRTSNRVYYIDSFSIPSAIYSATYDEDGLLSNFDTVGALPEKRRLYSTLETNGKIYIIGGTNGTTWFDTILVAEINPNGTIGEFTTLPYTLPATMIKMTLWVYGNYVYIQRASSIYYCPLSEFWPDSTNNHTAMREYNKVMLKNTLDYTSLRRVFKDPKISLLIATGETPERCVMGEDTFINLIKSKRTPNGFITSDSVFKEESLTINNISHKVASVEDITFGEIPNILNDTREVMSYGFNNNLINNQPGSNASIVDETALTYFETVDRVYANINDGKMVTTTTDGENIKAMCGYVYIIDSVNGYIGNNDDNATFYLRVYAKDVDNDIIGVDVMVRDNSTDEFTYLLEYEHTIAGFDFTNGSGLFVYIALGVNGVTKLVIDDTTETVFTPTTDGELCSHTIYGNIEFGNTNLTNPVGDTRISNFRFFTNELSDGEIAIAKDEAIIAKEILFYDVPANYDICYKPYRKNLPTVLNVSETEKVITYNSQEYIKPDDDLYIDDVKRKVIDVNENVVSVNPFETFNYPYTVRNNWVSDTLEVESNTSPGPAEELGINSYSDIVGVSIFTFILKNKCYMLSNTNIFLATLDENGVIGTFADIGPIGYGVYRGSCVVKGNSVYIMGGTADIPNKVIAATFDSEGNLGSFNEILTLPFDSIHSFTAFSYNDDIYIVGGYVTIGRIEYYDKVYKISNNVTTISELASLPRGAKFSESIVTKNRVYLYSNRYTTGIMYSELNYDGTLGPWKDVLNRDLPNDIFWSRRAMFKNALYVFGGYISSTEYSDKIYKANIDDEGVLGDFIEIATLPFAFNRGHLFVTNSYIYIFNPVVLFGDGKGNDLRFSITDGITRETATPNVDETVIEATVTHEPADYQTSIELESKDVNCELLDITFDGDKFTNSYGATGQMGRALQRKIIVGGSGTELIEPLNTELTIKR